MKKHTVKARSRSGTNSLELTIPASIVQEFDIESGDIFTIESESNHPELILKYKRVFSNK